MAYKRTPYLKTHEVAEALGISLGTIYNWLNSGKIAEPQRNPISRHREWTVHDVEVIRAIVTSGRPEAARCSVC